MSTRMADNATNGNPPEQQPSENNSNEVQSPIVMKIDAPEAEKVVEEAPVTYSFPQSKRSFSLLKPASGNSFGSGVPFSNTSSTMSHTSTPYGFGNPNPLSFSSLRSNPSPFGSGLGMFGSCSKPHLATSNSSSSSSPKPLLLRPSQLAVGSCEITNSETSSSEERIVSTSDSNEPDSNTLPNSTSDSPKKEATSSQDKNEPSSSQTSATTTSTQGGSMKFVPLHSTPQQKDDNCTVSGSGVSSSVTGFVFGQNLQERAEAIAMETPDSTSGRTAAIAGPSQAATSNGTSTSEMLFTSSVIRSDPATADSSGVETPSKSLSEAAAEYEEARANKRKYDEVAVFTGEEEEANVVQVNCKLFAYDNANGQWVERGRGTLRLNDRDGPGGVQSRVVMRTAGSLRVVLNTKIWGGMTVDRPSLKSIRLTAMEGTGQIKVFLVMASPKEIETLHKSMQTRVAKRQASEAENGDIIEPPTAFQNKRQELDDAGGGGDGEADREGEAAAQ